MKIKDLRRPDKLIVSGISSLTGLGQEELLKQKQEAKANAELTYIGDEKREKVESQVFRFNEKENEVINDSTEFGFLSSDIDAFKYWVNFHGIHEVDLLEKVAQEVNVERLTLRQILDTTQRPKLEEYPHYLYLSVKSVSTNESDQIEVEHLSFVLGKGFVITFQEVKGDHFDDIRYKMNNGIGFIRQRTSDYLLSQLLDAILDNFFNTIDKLNHEIAQLEKEIYNEPTKSSLITLEVLKSSALLVKKSLIPMKEAVLSLINSESDLMNPTNIKIFKDLSSSTLTALEDADSILRSLDGLSNIYFASLSQNMNEVMKVLTTVGAIFIPLTFIAGIYGMNFDNMPELRFQNGYFIIWGVMITVTIVMIIYFKKKKWI